MDSKYESLFTPWKIGNVEIKNRIVMCSMGGTCLFGFAEPNHWDEEAAKLILNVAKNNCGLILPGIAPVQDLVGNRWLYQGEGKFKNWISLPYRMLTVVRMNMVVPLKIATGLLWKLCRQ